MTKLAVVEQTAMSASDAKLYESLALRGDLSMLAPADKTKYYGNLCERLGLDPATQPFIPLKLNGKEILYASKGATDQLARVHCVNRRIIEEKEMRGIYIVTVEASLPNGRCEQEKGAVTIENLKGDAFCNAIMKAITKAKRRATLAILGLGMLDESELETIPQARVEYPQTSQTSPTPAQPVIDEDPLNRHLADLCKNLNSAGDSIKWSGKKLTEYANEKFDEGGDPVTSFMLLDDECKQILIADLEGRLSEVITAANEEQAIDGEVLDALPDSSE